MCLIPYAILPLMSDAVNVRKQRISHGLLRTRSQLIASDPPHKSTSYHWRFEDFRNIGLSCHESIFYIFLIVKTYDGSPN